MKAFRTSLMAAVFVLGAATQAFATTTTTSAEAATPVQDEQGLETYETTADEYMSPDELYEETRGGSSDAGFDSFADDSELLHARTKETKPKATDRLYILVDKSQKGTSVTAQTMQVYLDGQLIYNWLVSTGRETPEVAKSGKVYRSITPVGRFRIDWRSKNHVSSTWQAPMPYANFFIGGIAIHATTKSHYAALGSRDSGGCVRLAHENAKIMWDLIDQVGAKNVLIDIQNPANN